MSTIYDLDYLRRRLIDTSELARDYMGRVIVGSTDFMGRALIDTNPTPPPPDIQHVWNDSEPGATDVAVEGLEIATRFVLTASILVQGVRLWGTGDTITSDRFLKLWADNDQSRIFTEALPDTLGTGWVEWLLPEPVPLDDSDTYRISTNVGGYGFTAHACDVSHALTPVTYPIDAGVSNAGPGNFPDTVFNSTFYFVDLLFSIV